MRLHDAVDEDARRRAGWDVDAGDPVCRAALVGQQAKAWVTTASAVDMPDERIDGCLQRLDRKPTCFEESAQGGEIRVRDDG